MKRRCLVVILPLLLLLPSCFKVHLECPNDAIMTATVGGNQVGYQLISLGANAAKVAGLLAAKPMATSGTTAAGTTVDVSDTTWFGTETVSCGAMPNPQATPTPGGAPHIP